MFGIVVLVIPVLLVICNIVGFKDDYSRFYKFSRVFSIIFGGILYYGLTAVCLFFEAERGIHYSKGPGSFLALNIAILTLLLIGIFGRNECFSRDGSNLLTMTVITLNFYPAIYLLLTKSIALYGIGVLCPILYHVNLLIVSGSAIYKLRTSIAKGNSEVILTE